MRALSLFSGIGCFDYGVQRAGWTIAGQCEIEPFCRRALAKHWPDVWRFEDVRAITSESIREHCGPVDVVFGGPPCQPASVAGRRRGASDDRWLWPEFLRVVSEVAPVWVLAENPGGVLSLDVEGMGFREWIALQFANLGYQILPILLAASDVGATHDRERVWIVAHRKSDRCGEGRPESARIEGRLDAAECGDEMGFSDRGRRGWKPDEQGKESTGRMRAGGASEKVEHANGDVCGQEGGREHATAGGARSAGSNVGYADGARLEIDSRGRRDVGGEFAPIERASWPMGQGNEQWEWEEPRVVSSQSPMGIAAYGNARRLARWRRAGVKAIGNAVVPQCAEVIARAISRLEEGT